MSNIRFHQFRRQRINRENYYFLVIVVVVVVIIISNCSCILTFLEIITSTTIVVVVVVMVIIITRPKPAYGRQGLAGSWGQDTDEVSTFWGVLNISLRACGAKLGFKPTWDH